MSTQHIYMPLAEILAYQKAFSPQSLFEIAIRYMAIESNYDVRSQGSAIYRKALMSRGRDVDGHMDKLKALLESVEHDGFDGRTDVILDSKLRMTDGFNRIALALYLGVRDLWCIISKEKREDTKDGPWFKGFTPEETSLITRKAEELYSGTSQVLAFLLWAPAYEHFDHITEDISLCYDILGIRDREFGDDSFPQVLRELYNVPPDQQWKIESKEKALCKYPRRLRVLLVKISTSSFHPRAWHGRKVFPEATVAKTRVRRKYKHRVPGYFYDCIIHATDNWDDTVRVMRLLAPDFPIDRF